MLWVSQQQSRDREEADSTVPTRKRDENHSLTVGAQFGRTITLAPCVWWPLFASGAATKPPRENSGLSTDPFIQKPSKSYDSAAELSPTFPLDGGTVPLEKCRGRIQKPLIFDGFCDANRMKKRTVLFDALKNGFLHTFLAKILRFSRNHPILITSSPFYVRGDARIRG